jgi:hypothetical protein
MEGPSILWRVSARERSGWLQRLSDAIRVAKREQMR